MYTFIYVGDIHHYLSLARSLGYDSMSCLGKLCENGTRLSVDKIQFNAYNITPSKQ